MAGRQLLDVLGQDARAWLQAPFGHTRRATSAAAAHHRSGAHPARVRLPTRAVHGGDRATTRLHSRSGRVRCFVGFFSFRYVHTHTQDRENKP